jgi:hypothetical protein
MLILGQDFWDYQLELCGTEKEVFCQIFGID